jgi:SAM-dependent methyltransferase
MTTSAAMLLRRFFRQFGKPEGLLGEFVGHLMAIKNGARSRWALALLEPRAGERVLEIGCGPGVDLRRLGEAVGGDGSVTGVDLSPVMVRQTLRRNREAVAGGRARILEGSAMALPLPDAAFDAAYSSNSAQFWPDLERGQRELYRVLRPGGRSVVAVQPMHRGATETDALGWGERLSRAMVGAGFVDVRVETRALHPVLAVAVVARRA